jgi:hypothetical protein
MLALKDASLETFNLLFKDTSPRTARVESIETIPTVRSELFRVVCPPTTKLEFNDTSPDTLSFEFNEASPMTNNVSPREVEPPFCNAPSIIKLPPMDKFPFNDASPIETNLLLAFDKTTFPFIEVVAVELL